MWHNPPLVVSDPDRSEALSKYRREAARYDRRTWPWVTARSGTGRSSGWTCETDRPFWTSPAAPA